MYFSKEEYQTRWDRVYDEMDRLDLQAAVVWGRGAGTHERCGDVLYLTNYYNSQAAQEVDFGRWMAAGFSAVVLSARDTPILVTDMDFPKAELSTDRFIQGPNVILAVADVLSELRIQGMIGLVGTDFLPTKYYDALVSASSDISFVAVNDLLADVRRRKSKPELECLREAGEICSSALTRMMRTAVRGGISQADAAAEAAAAIVRGGGVPHMVSMSSGPTLEYFCGDPVTGASSAIQLRDGEIFRAWVMGPMFQGYWQDPGRSGVVGGKPTKRQREMLEATTSIVERLNEAVRPGVFVRDIVRLGDSLRSETGSTTEGLAELWPIYGHGIGLFGDPPQLVAGEEGTIRADDALGLEVFLHWPDVGTLGLEQNIIVGVERNESLTMTELRWW